MVYATTTQLADILGIKSIVPSWDVAGTPTNETVGTGDASTTLFYLDHQCILSDSYTLYYGATAATTTTLTEATHYTLAKDTGTITLTTAGVTLLSTSNIYAAYSYISNAMKDSYLVDVLARAETEVNKRVNSVFTDSSGANPSYPVETEIQTTEGLQMDRWLVKKKPLIDISSALDGDHAVGDTTIDVTAGTGTNFPISGTIIIGSEVMTYTGITTDQLTGVTRGTNGSTAAAHTSGDAIHTTVVYVSDTYENTDETFYVQPWDTSVYVTDTGLAYRYKDADPDVLTRAGVANRFKITYLYGYNTIPTDIVRLTLILAKRQLIQDNIGKAMISGRNEFRPEMFNVDESELNSIIDSYIVLSMGNT